MKMPGRSYFPPMGDQRDIFGLRHVTILGAAGESDAEHKRRIDNVQSGVQAAFKAAVHHLGETEARNLFAIVARKPKRGPGKAHATDRDHQLLKAYDDAMLNNETIAALARRLHAKNKKLGNTPEAIATQIRKLRDERTAVVRKQAREVRYWRMALRNEPPSLLSAAKSRKSP